MLAKNKTIVGSVGHLDKEIDDRRTRTGRSDPRQHQAVVRRVRVSDGHSVPILSEWCLLNLENATGHPSPVMSASFTNQVLAQIELARYHQVYERRVYMLPKALGREGGPATPRPPRRMPHGGARGLHRRPENRPFKPDQ